MAPAGGSNTRTLMHRLTRPAERHLTFCLAAVSNHLESQMDTWPQRKTALGRNSASSSDFAPATAVRLAIWSSATNAASTSWSGAMSATKRMPATSPKRLLCGPGTTPGPFAAIRLSAHGFTELPRTWRSIGCAIAGAGSWTNSAISWSVTPSMPRNCSIKPLPRTSCAWPSPLCPANSGWWSISACKRACHSAKWPRSPTAAKTRPKPIFITDSNACAGCWFTSLAQKTALHPPQDLRRRGLPLQICPRPLIRHRGGLVEPFAPSRGRHAL